MLGNLEPDYIFFCTEYEMLLLYLTVANLCGLSPRFTEDDMEAACYFCLWFDKTLCKPDTTTGRLD